MTIIVLELSCKRTTATFEVDKLFFDMAALRFTKNYTKRVAKITAERYPDYGITEKKCTGIFQLFLGLLTSAMIQQRWIKIDGYIKFYYLPGQLLKRMRENFKSKAS